VWNAIASATGKHLKAAKGTKNEIGNGDEEYKSMEQIIY
jgi:hypothetical protein